MPEHLKIVMIVSLMLVPWGLSAQEMGEADSTMMENDSSMHEMALPRNLKQKGMHIEMSLNLKWRFNHISRRIMKIP